MLVLPATARRLHQVARKPSADRCFHHGDVRLHYVPERYTAAKQRHLIRVVRPLVKGQSVREMLGKVRVDIPPGRPLADEFFQAVQKVGHR